MISICARGWAALWVLLFVFVGPVAALPVRSELQKPAGIDDASWAQLKDAIRGGFDPQARLAGDPSVAGADGSISDEFGFSVSISGDTAAIGAPKDDINNLNDRGSIYVYVRSGATWTQQAKLLAADGAAADALGHSVAIDGNTIVAGAYLHDLPSNPNQGAAYVFTRSGTSWTQQAKLVGADSSSGDQFGFSIALEGDTVIVGAVLDEQVAVQDQGSAYVFTRTGTTWTQQARLVANDGTASDFFGHSVSISGDSALIGAVLDETGGTNDQGSAYVFLRSGTSWSQQAKLIAADGATNDYFGHDVAISGNTALIGTPGDDNGALASQGSAYVYTRSGTTWTAQSKLLASDGLANDQFGISVALVGDTALIGAEFDDQSFIDFGAAYVFTRSGSAWSEQQKLLAADGEVRDQFGNSVALSGETALIGARLDDVGANADQGSAYAFTRAGTGWSQQARLQSGNGARADGVGISVAISGSTAIVGASGDDIGLNREQGSAYVYVRNGTNWVRQAQLLATDGAASHGFGNAVALFGDTAAVSASLRPVGNNGVQGGVYIFQRNGTTWTQQALLLADDGASLDSLGFSIALSGDTVIAGAFCDIAGIPDLGAAYVFVRSGTTWTQQAKLLATDGAASDFFGFSVALDSNTALVGRYLDNVGVVSDQGSAEVFVRSGTTWTSQAQLFAADGAANDNFGFSVAVHGDTALVGAHRDDGPANDQGSVYVYTRSGSAWTFQTRLTASDGLASDEFGSSVALSGNRALIGAREDDVGVNSAQGSAYVFLRNGSAWTQEAQLTAASGRAADGFGIAVALDATSAIVGASREDGTLPFGNVDEGAAYAFGDGAPPSDLIFANGFQ
jgi:hypothetical protein